MTSALAQLGDRFATVHVRLALLALAFHVANHALRSLAWRNVLAAAYPRRRVRLLDVGVAYAAGVALNALLPARGGDAAKIAILRARIADSSVATITASMSVVVLFDAVAATVLVAVVCATGLLPFAPSAGALPVAGAVLATLVAVALLVRRFARGRLAALWQRLRLGGAILRTPGRYARSVALVQCAAWCCRIAVVFFLLAAFGLQASVPVAAMVMVLCGASTLVPLTPGGAGTQQVLLAYALRETASATAAVSFSVGLQAGVTVVNALLGLLAAMVAFRTLRPVAALRAGVRLARTPVQEGAPA